jgi:hypothetical protein
MNLDDKTLEQIAKCMMTSPAQKEKVFLEIKGLMEKIYELFTKEQVKPGLGTTTLLMCLADVAVSSGIDKAMMCFAFDKTYEAMKQISDKLEEEEKE